MMVNVLKKMTRHYKVIWEDFSEEMNECRDLKDARNYSCARMGRRDKRHLQKTEDTPKLNSWMWRSAVT